MNRTVALVVVSLMLIAEGMGCSTVAANPPDTHPAGNTVVEPDGGTAFSPTSPAIEETRAMNVTRLSNIVGGIIDHPGQLAGQTVEIIGYYRGWDLLKEVQGTPPVTRSDWVIADSSGAIYVTGVGPQGLDPASKEATTKIIRLVATVQQNQNGVYLQAISVELVSAE